MLRVYIAGPISKGDREHNYRQAVQAAYDLIDAGIAVYCPHLWMVTKIDPTPSDETDPRRLALLMANDIEWIKASNALLRLPGESVGSDEEVRYAKGSDIPVFYSVADVINATR